MLLKSLCLSRSAISKVKSVVAHLKTSRSQIFKNKQKGVGCKLVMLTSHMQANVWQTYHLDTNLSAT